MLIGKYFQDEKLQIDEKSYLLSFLKTKPQYAQ